MKKLFLIIFSLLLLGLRPANAAAQCELTQANWFLGPVKTGQPSTIVVTGTNCANASATITIYKSALVDTPIAVRTIKFPSNALPAKDANFVLTQAEYENGRSGSENTLSVYFVADVGGSTAKSNTTNFTFVVTPPAGGGGTGDNGGTGGGAQPTTTQYTLKIDSPAQFSDLVDLVNLISTWIFNLAIPVAVIIIIYAGIRFLLSRGNETEITNARHMLTYAVVGLGIVLIGKGFVTLVTSIIDLGNSSTPSTKSQGTSNNTPVTGASACNPACSTNQACIRTVNTDGTTVEWHCE